MLAELATAKASPKFFLDWEIEGSFDNIASLIAQIIHTNFHITNPAIA
jgi:hypothetical protein